MLNSVYTVSASHHWYDVRNLRSTKIIVYVIRVVLLNGVADSSETIICTPQISVLYLLSFTPITPVINTAHHTVPHAPLELLKVWPTYSLLSDRHPRLTSFCHGHFIQARCYIHCSSRSLNDLYPGTTQAQSDDQIHKCTLPDESFSIMNFTSLIFARVLHAWDPGKRFDGLYLERWNERLPSLVTTMKNIKFLMLRS